MIRLLAERHDSAVSKLITLWTSGTKARNLLWPASSTTWQQHPALTKLQSLP